MSQLAKARLRRVFRRMWQAWPALLASLVLDSCLLSGGPERPFPVLAAPTGAACIPSTITYAPTWWPACTAAGAVVTSGTVTAVDPYNASAAQATKVGSFTGIAGFNGATVDALLSVNGGQLETSLYGATGNALTVSAAGAATVAGIGVAGTPAGGVVSVQGVAGGTVVPVSGTFFQGVQPVSCSAGSVCPTNATLQAGSANAGGFELFDAAGTNKANINLPGGLLTSLGKTATILTSGSATACTNIQATAGNLVELVNVGSATAVFPAFYNDAGTTCATAARVYGNFTSLTLQAGQAIQLNIPLSAGLAYKLSGALSDNLVVVTQ